MTIGSPTRRTVVNPFLVAGGSSGAAGGDLTGTYPNPSLATVNPNVGTFGDATHVPQATFDAKGRVTSVANVTIVTPTFSRSVKVNSLATSGDGSIGSPWAGWETPLMALPAGHFEFPWGYYTKAIRVNFKQGSLITGDGMEGSVILDATTVSGLFLGDPTNGATPTHVSSWYTVRDLKIVCSNAGSTGSGILVVYNNFTTIERVHVEGFRYGVSAIYAEILNVVDCYLNSAAIATGTPLWIVDNGDYSLANADADFSGALSGVSNVINVKGCQLAAHAAMPCLVDDGGYSHFIGPNNNFIGGSMGIRQTATNNGVTAENHSELVGPFFRAMTTFWKSGGAAAANASTTLRGNTMSTTGGGSPIVLDAASTRTLLVENCFPEQSVPTISGCAAGFVTGVNASATVIGSVPQGGALVFDALPAVPSVQINGSAKRALMLADFQQVFGPSVQVLNAVATTYANWAGGAITVTTNATDKVKLKIIGMMRKSTGGIGSIVVDRGGTKLPGVGVTSFVQAQNIGIYEPFNFEYVDIPGAGTFTYQVQVWTSDANTMDMGGGVAVTFITEVWR